MCLIFYVSAIFFGSDSINYQQASAWSHFQRCFIIWTLEKMTRTFPSIHPLFLRGKYWNLKVLKYNLCNTCLAIRHPQILILELVTIHFTLSIVAELAETKYLDNAFDAAVSSYFSQLMAQLFCNYFCKKLLYIWVNWHTSSRFFLPTYLKFA